MSFSIFLLNFSPCEIKKEKSLLMRIKNKFGNFKKLLNFQSKIEIVCEKILNLKFFG